MNAPWKGPADDLVINSEMAPMPIRLIFPETVAEFIEFCAKDMAVDPVSVAMPALATMAASVGRSRKLQLSATWFESAALWTVLLGYSGEKKSAGLSQATKPLSDENARLMLAYEANKKAWDELVAGLKPGDPRPSEPQRDRLLSTDPTFEAVVDLMADSPRFGLIAKDELDTWFSSFTRYSNASSEGNWLSLYNASTLTVDRKTKGPDGKKSRLVQDALVSLTGAIQPYILAQALNSGRWASGLGPRLIIAAPPEKEEPITLSYEIDRTFLDGYAFAVQKVLRDLDGTSGGILRFESDAHAIFNEDYNDRQKRRFQIKDKGSLRRGQLAKLLSVAPRWALVHFIYCQVMAGNPTHGVEIGIESLAAGIALADWCERESARIQGILSGAENEAGNAHYVAKFRQPEFLQGMTAREFFRLNRSGAHKLTDTEHAKETLAGMVKAGALVEFQHGTTAQGGRPTTMWKLAPGQ
jgi:hypothetical protein